MQRQTHGITEWLCRVADLRGGQRILDLACGSGQPALTAARLVKPGGSVVATDLSEAMLRVARRKANMADMDNIEFRVMDEQTIEFEDASFDGVLSRWGLMFCPSPEATVKEVYRVLKPNRPFATATWAKAEQNPYFEITTRLASKALGAPPPGPDAPTPLRLSDTSRIQAMLKDAGFRHIEIESRPMAFEFNSLDDFWRITADFTPMLRQAMQQLDDAGKARLKSDLQDEASKFREGGKIRFPGLAIGAYAQK
jgi:SAM-dependent methyltransferase